MIFDKEIVRYHHGHHDHDHCHEHSHEESSESKDEKTLKILLVHWINHNETHEEGFREWVEKARAIGKEETAKSIEKAIEYMEEANKMLLEAKKHM
ncbi:zinc transporter [Clostridioides difficile]|uniref:zinc transporter n=1 Tax=Clostridioides difficile TaxID=1496 RepID=UPI00103454CF|nr:zinc transporter [Clostridioides difficile]